MSRLRSGYKGRRGQAMVELALSLPLLLAVLAGIIELSLLISHASCLQEAVDQAARGAAESKCSLADIKQSVARYLENDKLLDIEDLEVDAIEDVDPNGTPMIRVTASVSMRPFGFTKTGNFRASASAVYRKEWRGALR